MDYQVNIATVTEHFIAASRERTTLARVSQDIQRLLAPVWTFIRAQHIWSKENNSGHNVAVYYGTQPCDSVEAGVQVMAPFAETAEIGRSATPAGRIATTAHFGNYNQLCHAQNAVIEFCKQNGCEIVLPFWEIYGDWNDDWAK